MKKPPWLAMFGIVLAALAFAQTPLPPLHESGRIQYLSGGIGSDEADAIEAAASQWPLVLEFAVEATPRAQHTAGVGVQIEDLQGSTLLKMTAEGPYLLAKLPPGTYVVKATREGDTKTQKLIIRTRGQARALFLWPAAG